MIFIIVNMNIFIRNHKGAKNMNLEKIIAENMLRFGTKNISESDVRNRLTEVDDNTEKNLKTQLRAINDGNDFTITFKPGSTYTTQNSYAAFSYAINPKYAILFPKGTTFTATADGQIMTAPAKVVNITDIKPLSAPGGEGIVDITTRLNNGEFIYKLAMGQIDSVNGGKVKPTENVIGTCLNLPGTVTTTSGISSLIKFPDYAGQLLDKLKSFKA